MLYLIKKKIFLKRTEASLFYFVQSEDRIDICKINAKSIWLFFFFFFFFGGGGTGGGEGGFGQKGPPTSFFLCNFYKRTN